MGFRILCFVCVLVLGAGVGLGTGVGEGFANPYRAVIIVNDEPITAYEIDQRERMLRLLTGATGSEAVATARDDLINERLYLHAAKVLSLTASEEELDEASEDFASRGTLNLAGLIRYLADNGVDADSFRQFIRSNFLWQRVLGLRFAAQAQISDAEVEAAAANRDEAQVMVSLSEIVIPHDRGGQIAARRAIRELTPTLLNADDFASAARRLSASPSADNSGQLPPIPLASMPVEAMLEVMTLSEGELSAPVELDGATVIYRLNRRSAGGSAGGTASDSVFYALVNLAGAGDSAAQESAAQELIAQSDDCVDLRTRALELDGVTYAEQSAVEDKPTRDIREVLARLDEFEAEVLTGTNGGDGMTIIMLCSRIGALQDADRSRLRDAMFARRIDEIGEGYLQELRANAHIIINE